MKRFVFFPTLLLVFAGCTSAPDTFLIQKLDDQSKARALTTKGIEEYQLQLVRKGDFARISEVREYFSVALSYDPDNLQAKQYLDLVDDFKNSRVRQNVKDASGYLAKAKRKEEEDYAMCVAVVTAVRLDPTDPSVTELQKDTDPTRVNLVGTYLTRVKATLAKIDKDTPVLAREAAYIEAYRNVDKVVQIDPANNEALSRQKSLRDELAKAFNRRGEDASTLIRAGKYDDARIEIASLADLNKMFGGGLEESVKASTYSLNYEWAKSLYAKKDYPQATVKIDAALSAKKTDEATSLRNKLSAVSGQAKKEATFEAALQDIDKELVNGDLVSAKKDIDAADKATNEPAKQTQLDTRREKLLSLLKDVYAKAVENYRNEHFKDAIDLLRIVVQVDVNYEQAADYLDKAKAKQKLIDAY